MLRKRLLFGSLMIAATLAVLVVDAFFGPYYPILAVAVVAMGWAASNELVSLFRTGSVGARRTFCRYGAVTILVSNWLVPTGWWPVPTQAGIAIPFAVFTLLGMVSFVREARDFEKPGGAVSQLAGTLLILFYVGVLPSFFVQLRWLGDSINGAVAIALVLIVVKGCDIGAFFIGRQLGKHKLAPVLSPGKTVEGFVGGLICSALVAVFFAWIDGQFRPRPTLSMEFSLLFGFVVALAGQVGDLAESLIKRDCHQKDASRNIPGFGGVLDVIDSVVFAAPVAYLILVWE